MQVVTAIDEHLHTAKPEAFAIMEKIITEKCKNLFPVFTCHFSHNICHSLYIGGSLDARDTWAHGIYENSRYFRAHVFTATQWHREGGRLSFEPSCKYNIPVKMRGRKETDPVKLANYIVKQLEKFAANI